MTKANKIAKKKRRLNILVSGSTGQLGQELKFLSEKFKTFNFDFKDRKQLDLSSEKQIKRVLSGRYDYFINAGAYTAVDKAEEEKKLAHIINAKALGHIANYASPKLNIIHVSSDYVYHSNPGRPLLESDKTAPRILGLFQLRK